MTQSTQPLPATPDSQPRPREQHAARLLHMWSDLTYRATAAEAHGSIDAEPLWHQRRCIEEVLVDTGYLDQDAVDALIVWDAELIHSDPQTTPERCLICRKARLGLPLDLPIPSIQRGRDQ